MRDGDLVSLDVAAGTLDLSVDAEEIQRRPARNGDAR
ncbi:dihydroxy-acid dehydratase [Actinomadura citrea]